MMRLYSRLSARFLVQLGSLVLMIWCVVGAVAVWYVSGNRSSTSSGAPSPAFVLQQMPGATTVQDGRVTVSASVLPAIRRSGGWLQVLDGNGLAIYSYHTPAGVPTKYAPGVLVYDRLNPQVFGYTMATWYASVDHQSLTWVYGVPLGHSRAPARRRGYLVASLVLGTLASTIVSALLFGRQLGQPVIHMLDWLQNLARGSYGEPTDRRGAPRSRTADGVLRRPYRVFREVVAALEQLAASLRQAERDRGRLEQTREEWVTGVTHDLRTPLSSVKGYADLLAGPNHTWSEQETRGFGRIISEMAAHMDGLIEDLGLTFRLRNNGLPLQRAPVDVAELVRRVVIGLVNAPGFHGQTVTFQSAPDHIVYPVDAKWFTRAVDNLVSNASVHNPQGTAITVSVQAAPNARYRYPGVRVRITDNGAGMDQETLEHLFDRYYRGTNTSEAQGKGSGLGTAIARQLIEAHGGEVAAGSAPGQGTTLEITLPARS